MRLKPVTLNSSKAGLEGIWRSHVGEHRRRPCNRPVDSVLYGRAVFSVDVEREQEIKQVLVKPSATARNMLATLEHRSFNFEVSYLAEWLRGVHNKKIGEQELGQRMIAVLVQWPVYLSVESVVESEVSIKPCAEGLHVFF